MLPDLFYEEPTPTVQEQISIMKGIPLSTRRKLEWLKFLSLPKESMGLPKQVFFEKVAEATQDSR